MSATLQRAEGGLVPADTNLSPCFSCGKPASVQLYVGLCCGRCAYLMAEDTLGTIAAVVMDLGAA
jgi:hypothetical protein